VKQQACDRETPHGPHEWYWRSILRRECPGVVGVMEPCGRKLWHGPHWYGEHRDELCPGLGLAGICAHGVQMLNQCDECEKGAA
jgi:hypothetical protein